jgi:hypothetical protein
VRWLLLKDLQILRRSPLVTALLIAYPIVIAVLIGFALSRGPVEPEVAFFNQVPPGEEFPFGDETEFGQVDARSSARGSSALTSIRSMRRGARSRAAMCSQP